MGSQSIEGETYFIEDVSNVFSPGLLIFSNLLESNLDEMIRIAGASNRLCPHCKTHKTREIAKLMLDRGVEHHKCATIAEAEMLASVGAPAVLIAYQMVGPNVRRLSELVDIFPATRFATLIDNPDSLKVLAGSNATTHSEFCVLIDLDSGMGRTGIRPGAAALELIELICSTKGVEFGGLHWYDGHHRQPDLNARRSGVLEGWEHLQRFRNELRIRGIDVPRVVAGGTGSFSILADSAIPGLQLSPGTTALFDADMAERFPELTFAPALAILSRVVSCNRSGHLTLDVGHKSCAADQPAGRRLFFPALPDAREIAHTEEHCVIATTSSDRFRPGDPLLAFPRHACPTSAVHQFATVVDSGQIVDRWEISARDRQINV